MAYFTATASGNTLSIQTDSSMAAMLWISMGMLILLLVCCVRFTCNAVPALVETVYNIGKQNENFNPGQIWEMVLDSTNSNTPNKIQLNSEGKQDAPVSIFSQASDAIKNFQTLGFKNNPYNTANDITRGNIITPTQFAAVANNINGYAQSPATFAPRYDYIQRSV